MPKIDGFFSLTPREFDGLLAQIYSYTNADWSPLKNFLGVAQETAPDNLLAWQPRKNFLPLVTAGQKPVFVDESSMTSPFLSYTDFDAAKFVFLPDAERNLVTITNQTTAKIIEAKFHNQSVDITVEASEPSLVVVAQTYHHNWRVTIDGQPAQVLRANVAFQAVQIPANARHVRFYYQDDAFFTGLTLTTFTALGLAVSFWLMKRKNISVG